LNMRSTACPEAGAAWLSVKIAVASVVLPLL
jgi:hypothetical protein